MESGTTPVRTKAIVYGVSAVVVLIPLFFLGLSNHGLWRPDEPRVAEIGREMAVTGNWVVPTLNGKPFLEKPPFYFWSLGAIFKVFGHASDGVARIPSAIFGLGGAIAAFFLASILFGPRVGFLSALILSTSYEYFLVSHRVLTDSALACFVISAMAFFMAAYLSEKKGQRLLCYTLFYLFCGLAFLSKGFVGLTIPGVGVLTFLIFERNLRTIWCLRLWLGILIFVVMTLPWFWALWRQGGWQYLEVLLIQNNVRRFLPGGVRDFSQPLYYYLTELPGGFLPWSLLLLPVLYRLFSKREELPAPSDRGLLFTGCWFFSGFLFLSVAANKRVIYLLPIAAPFAILTAHWIEATLKSKVLGKMEKTFLWLFGFCVLGGGLVIVLLYFYLSGGVSVFALIFSTLMAGISVGSLAFLQRGKITPFWAGTLGVVSSTLVFILLGIVPVLDRERSLVPFFRQVKESVRSDRPLYIYRPDEILRGAVPFYTGRFVEEIYDRSLLLNVLDREHQVFVIAMGKRGDDGQERGPGREMTSMGGVYLLARRKEDDGRVYSLFTNKGSGSFEKDD